MSQAVQLLIDEGRELCQRRLVAVAPGYQQPRDFFRRVRPHTNPCGRCVLGTTATVPCPSDRPRAAVKKFPVPRPFARVVPALKFRDGKGRTQSPPSQLSKHTFYWAVGGQSKHRYARLWRALRPGTEGGNYDEENEDMSSINSRWRAGA